MIALAFDSPKSSNWSYLPSSFLKYAEKIQKVEFVL